MKRMVATFTLLGFGLALTGLCAAKGKTPVTVTGCLAQGDERNEYAIKDSAGKTYGLKSSKVNLKSHPGHQVTVTGTEYKENEAKEKKERKSGQAEESEHLRISELKMVSASCQ
jgi:hypothetical protein